MSATGSRAGEADQPTERLTRHDRTCSFVDKVRALMRRYEPKIPHAQATIKVAMIIVAGLRSQEIEPQSPIKTEVARRLKDSR